MSDEANADPAAPVPQPIDDGGRLRRPAQPADDLVRARDGAKLGQATYDPMPAAIGRMSWAPR